MRVQVFRYGSFKQTVTNTIDRSPVFTVKFKFALNFNKNNSSITISLTQLVSTLSHLFAKLFLLINFDTFKIFLGYSSRIQTRTFLLTLCQNLGLIVTHSWPYETSSLFRGVAGDVSDESGLQLQLKAFYYPIAYDNLIFHHFGE